MMTTTPSPSTPLERPARRAFARTAVATALGAAALCSALPAWATVDPAMQAWARGDYATALKLLQPKADAGDPEALFNVGLYHFQGMSGTKNEAEAARLFRKAAEKGHIMAANNLGAMYLEGRGVPKAPTEAWFWLATVAHRGDPAAGVLRDMAASKMTASQIDAAHKRFDEWVDRNDPPWYKKIFRLF